MSVVRAAGGLVWRTVPTGAEVVLVHRPKYDDWALPKGKAEPAEPDEAAALREVNEETGLSCRLGEELPTTTYVDADGRLKAVRYWAMTAVPTAGQPLGALRVPPAQDEVDCLLWLPVDEARRRLTYPRDVVVLDALARRLGLNASEAGRQEVDSVLEGEPEGDQAG